jgi:hypothetical protein
MLDHQLDVRPHFHDCSQAKVPSLVVFSLANRVMIFSGWAWFGRRAATMFVAPARRSKLIEAFLSVAMVSSPVPVRI